MQIDIEYRPGTEPSIHARVTWEDSQRQTGTVKLGGAVVQNAPAGDALLLMTFVPALRHGEKRIRINAEISPILEDNLAVAAGWLNRWHGASRVIPKVDAPRCTSGQRAAATASAFVSGGVDSMFTLLRRQRLHPTEGSAYPRKALMAFGTSYKDYVDREMSFARFQRDVETVRAFSSSLELELAVVIADFLFLDPSPMVWMREYHGSALAGLAHATVNTPTLFYIGSTNDIENMVPWGPHPLLDAHFSSELVRFEHDGEAYSRLDKLRYIVEHSEDALRSLIVCNKRVATVPNCGRCEKCVRTKLELRALHQDVDGIFEDSSFDLDMMREVLKIDGAYVASCYRDLLRPLRGSGDRGIRRLIEHRLRGYRIRRTRGQFTDALKRVDGEMLNGTLKRTARALR